MNRLKYFCMLSKIKLVRNLSLHASKNQKKNHYDCLGVSSKATQGDIKTAYYKLSKQYHPDVNKGNEKAASMFRDITAAYEVLGNLKSRRTYDRGLSIHDGDEVIYTSKEPQVKYEHASFYRHRNKPVNRKNTSTPHYNMDEWTRAHYSSTFTEEFARKKYEAQEVNQRFREEKESEETWKFVFMIFMIALCTLGYGSMTDYDNVTEREINNKEK